MAINGCNGFQRIVVFKQKVVNLKLNILENILVNQYCIYMNTLNIIKYSFLLRKTSIH